MKITITLSEAQVNGLKEYLKSVNEPFDKKGITREISGIVSGNLNIGALGDYVNKYEYPKNQNYVIN